MILNIVPLIGPIFTLQTTETIFRFLFECKTEKEKKADITNAFVIYMCGIIVFVLYIPFSVICSFKYSFLFGSYFIILYLGLLYNKL